MNITLLIESLIVGALCGVSTGALAARMFYAPEVMAAGAWRTLGELNACMGDPVSHFSFGFSWLLGSWTNNLAFGGIGQDFLHRTVPNFGAGLLLLRDKNPDTTIKDPWKMGVVCGIVGAVIYSLMNLSGDLIPSFVTENMMKALTPAADYMMIVMQILYLIACLDNGKYTAICGLIMGGFAFLVTGNACSGLILGILTGKTIEQNGIKSKVSIIFIVLMVVIWVAIAHFRGFWPKFFTSFSVLSELFH